jgi:serine phosphatase RsbU (regulator of sigma subunit)
MSGMVEAAKQGKSKVERWLYPLAELFWPELKGMSETRRMIGVGEVLTVLYASPLAVLGLIWLVLLTDLDLLLRSLPQLFALAGVMILFRKFGFFMISEIRSGRYATLDGSLDNMVLWVAVLLFGPSALWLATSWAVLDFLWRWRGAAAAIDRWSRIRNFSLYVSVNTLGAILAFLVYQRLGGAIPLPDLSPAALLPAMAAFVAFFLLQLVLWGGYILYAVWTQISITRSKDVRPILRFITAAFLFPNIAHPFAALLAGAYSQNGLYTFLFILVGMLMVAFLARQLSWAAEQGRQKSRQVEKLERLGRAILEAPPDASTLPDILEEHVPAMFPSGRVAIWLQNGKVLLKHPDEWSLDYNEVGSWIAEKHHAQAIIAQQPVPWTDDVRPHNAIVAAPILDNDRRSAIGGVYLELYSLTQPWDKTSLENLFPAVQSLAAQVASALQQARVYSQALAYEKISQELSLAGRIQASFLPAELPPLPGWQLAVTLLPARETSGDYFDLIPLSNGKLGVLIADVTDKGVGAALYMALSRTLIRTYAIEFDEDSQPEVILFAANNRLLADARADLFVTVFFGVLDPETGELTYANAGHNPPFLLQADGEGTHVESLNRTGMPLGVEEDEVWNSETITIKPGDVLLLYTDGIPDAGNVNGDFLGEDLLITSALSCPSRNAEEIQGAILETVSQFSDGVPQFDDITLLVLVRDLEPE